MKERFAWPVEISSRVQLCAENQAMEIAGETLEPDVSKAYVEFYLSHSFPVTTSDRTTIHPATVANSYKSLRHQVFNLGHLMHHYDPERIARDRVLGMVVGVEFPPAPMGGWAVQSDRAKAPGIRAVASMAKWAEGADRILGGFQSGRKKWTVSMENMFFLEESGYLIAKKAGIKWPALDKSPEHATPKDLVAAGYYYLAEEHAPDGLRACFDADQVKVVKTWQGCELLYMLGGLNGRLHYKGAGLTPLGKEPEARVARMLASGAPGGGIEADEQVEAALDVMRRTLEVCQGRPRTVG